ncbi:MAG: glycogen-binding domain-containing protein [Victivallaceae bacterium]|nr:glycogen-binding domain-containing protein [Victivallaceae bacterium]
MFTVGDLKKDGKYRVEFRYAMDEGRQVMLAGSFNDWAQVPMTFDGNGGYAVAVKLDPGYYEYRFVVDGVWQSDESNPSFAANDFGTLNSVLRLD